MKSTLCFTVSLALLINIPGLLIAADSIALLQQDFKAHCIQCHGEGGEFEGDIDLVGLQSSSEFAKDPKRLENIIAALTDRQMPPADETPLSDKTRERMIGELNVILQQALKSYPFEPTPIRRMNRFQYNNAVVDLLELDRDIFQLNERLLRRRDDYFRPATRKMPDAVKVSCRPLSKDIDNQRPEGFRGVAAFPQDQRAEHGFDNRADHLTLSPLLMESFLQLSQTIVESPDLNANECRSWDRLFSAPGQAVRGPVDGRYEAEKSDLVRVVGTPDGNAVRQEMGNRDQLWSSDAHLFWRCRGAQANLIIEFVTIDQADGLRFRLTKAGDYGVFDIYLDDKIISETVDLYNPNITLTNHDVSGLSIAPGRHRLTIKCSGKNELSAQHFFGLDYIETTGRNTVEKSSATDIAMDDAVRNRIKTLLRRAFRRPVDGATLKRFTQFAETELAAGKSFEQMMRTVVGAVLGMPEFLYLYESQAAEKVVVGDARRQLKDDVGRQLKDDVGRQLIDDFELATRLAQFFWSSIPDDSLLELAEAGTLHNADVLSEQIDRMMNDRRSARFCDNFPAQWLQLDRLVTSIPDREKFPYFYYSGYRTSLHMMSEPLLLFETVFVEDRSVIELLDPKFTWQSDMLRANYEGHSKGGGDVQVQTFRRVPLDDPRRGGVITNAAVMTMTSTPTRTQPITRGAWVNAVIFNDPPEPPPADVPVLPESNSGELAKLTIRERLALHRKRADCAGCHNKIDPLGFALENYGPTGVWRDKYENGRDVDVSGILFNQHEFDKAVEFKRLIVQEKHRFIRAFVSHLLSYALGRELGPADSPTLDDMTAKAMAGEDSLRAVMKGVAMSKPFSHKGSVRE